MDSGAAALEGGSSPTPNESSIQRMKHIIELVAPFVGAGLGFVVGANGGLRTYNS